VFGREIVAQLHTIWPEFGFAIVASKLQYASMLHDFLWFFVQTHSRTLQKHESSTGNGLDVKKIAKSFERKFVKKFLDLNL
jgi:hypothetical protein